MSTPDEPILSPMERCEAAWDANTNHEEKWAAIMLIVSECALIGDGRCKHYESYPIFSGMAPEWVVAKDGDACVTFYRSNGGWLDRRERVFGCTL